jgi:hypothetical protein
MDTKQKGDITESKVLARFTELGYSILVPWGDNDRYDLIFENEHGSFKRIQCKTGNVINNESVIVFRVHSSSAHRNGKRPTYHGEVDYFAVWCEYNDKIYLVPFSEVGNLTSEARLRLTETKNGQNKGVRFAKDFEL